MSLRRSKLEIMYRVLSAVLSGVSQPTRIMYSVHLSWDSTRKILAGLVDQGFLKKIEKKGDKRIKRKYMITEKGENAVKYFEEAKKLLKLEIEM